MFCVLCDIKLAGVVLMENCLVTIQLLSEWLAEQAFVEPYL